MPLHFTPSEYAARTKAAAAALQAADLDALLVFAPESQYWLTGYDTFGFAMFQCMVLQADGQIDLLTRLPDFRQALFTSTLTEAQLHLWHDTADTSPPAELVSLLRRLNLHEARIGVETRTPALPYAHGAALTAALPNLREASDLIPPLRRIKSPTEISYHRRAAALADDALDACLAEARPGTDEGALLAAMHTALLQSGGEVAANEIICGSGPGALMCRSYAGRRPLAETDQLTLEWAGSYRRYHAAMMRTLVVGTVPPQQIAMHAACVEAIDACEAAIRPGAPMSDVYEAHARVFDAHGLAEARLRACGYAMGAVFAPIWVDFPMFHAGNPLPMEPGQVFFLHMILMDDTTGYAMTLGHSVLVTETGPERLSRHALDLHRL